MSRRDLSPDDFDGLAHTAHQRDLMQAWQRAQKPYAEPFPWGIFLALVAAFVAAAWIVFTGGT